MTLTELTTDHAGVSRRRVIQGAAWATPAVLVAMSTPAAAASLESTPSAITFVSPGAGQSGGQLYAFSTLTSFTSARSVAAPASVRVIRQIISVPASRVNGADPVVLSPAWTYVGRVTEGGKTKYTFEWLGDDLTSAQNSTSEMLVQLPRTASSDPITVTFSGTGVSAGVDVFANAETSAGLVGNLIWNDVHSSGNYSGDFHMGFHLRHDGPWSPTPDMPIDQLHVILEYPDQLGELPQFKDANGWTMTDQGVVSGVRRVRLDNPQTLQRGHGSNSTTATLKVKQKNGITKGAFKYTAFGRSGGVPITAGTRTVTY